MARNKLAIDDVAKFAELLSSRDHGHEDENAVPKEANPAKYKRHVEITDAESLKLIEGMDDIFADMRKLVRKLEAYEARMRIARSELFERLEEVHPTILNARRGGCGLKDWRGKWWYVAWDGRAYDNETDDRAPGDGQGQYL